MKRVKGRILMADDEKTFLHATADLLRREGYEVETCHDGLAAAALLNVSEFDLLIADIQMPGNPQLELIKHLPSIAGGMPVLLVTGYPTLRSEILAVDLPVVSYMVKPVKFEELLARAQSAITQTEALRRAKLLRGRLVEWMEDMDSLIRLMDEPPNVKAFTPETLTTLTLKNQVACLAMLEEMWQKLASNHSGVSEQGSLQEKTHALRTRLADTLRLFNESNAAD